MAAAFAVAMGLSSCVLPGDSLEDEVKVYPHYGAKTDIILPTIEPSEEEDDTIVAEEAEKTEEEMQVSISDNGS